MKLIYKEAQLRGGKGEFIRNKEVYQLPDGTLLWMLTKGKVMYTDFEDYTKLIPYAWRAHPACDGNPHGKFYAIGSNAGEYALAHNVISGKLPDKITVDHKDSDGCNNLKSNLRLATKKQQRLNQARHGGQKRKDDDYSSSYRGLTRRKSGTWRVRVRRIDGTQKDIGTFTEEVEAAKAWDDFMYNEFKEDFPLQGISCGGIAGEPTVNFIQFNFPERLSL